MQTSTTPLKTKYALIKQNTAHLGTNSGHVAHKPTHVQNMILIKERRRFRVVCSGLSLEPRYQEKARFLGYNLTKDAIKFIQANPYKVASMHEFLAKLEEEVEDIQAAIRKRDIKDTHDQHYDLLVKAFAWKILSDDILEIR